MEEAAEVVAAAVQDAVEIEHYVAVGKVMWSGKKMGKCGIQKNVFHVEASQIGVHTVAQMEVAIQSQKILAVVAAKVIRRHQNQNQHRHQNRDQDRDQHRHPVVVINVLLLAERHALVSHDIKSAEIIMPSLV